MPLYPAIADAYRKVVVTTGTGGGGIPGTTTSHEVGGELNLDAGFGISLVTDVLNNKVTIVNTGNGTGALTTITENNSNGTYYPIFTRSPPGTQTFTVGASDFTSGAVTLGLDEIRITGSSNSPTAVSAPLRAAIVGLIPGETFSLIKVSDGATLNFTVAEPPTGHFAGEYDDVLGCWRIYITAAPIVTDTFVSITIATGTGEMNPITGTYQMDTMYLDQTTTPLTYNPSLGLLTVNTLSVASTFAVTGHVTLEGVTTTGATGTGKLVFDTSPSISDPTITGHATIEGVTATGATGSGKFVFDTTPTIAGGSITGLTTFGLRDTTAAYDVRLAATSTSATLTANRTITIDVGDAARTVKLNGNLSLGGTFTTDNNVTIAGPYEITITPSGVFNATFPAGTYSLPKNDQTFYVGTTALTINRASASQALTGITSIDGNAATVTDGVYTTGSYANPTWITSLAASKVGLGNVTNESKATMFTDPTFTGHITAEGVTATGATGTGNLVFSASPTFTGTVSGISATMVGLGNVTNESKETMFTDPSFTGTITLAPTSLEAANISATAATGTVNVDAKTNTVWYYTANASANWTFNFRGDGSTALNTYLATGKSVSIAFMVTQGATAYYPTTFTIDGNATGAGGYTFSFKWLGGAAPTGGNASSVDVYTFSVVKTADKTFTVLASQGRFA